MKATLLRTSGPPGAIYALVPTHEAQRDPVAAQEAIRIALAEDAEDWRLWSWHFQQRMLHGPGALPHDVYRLKLKRSR